MKFNMQQIFIVAPSSDIKIIIFTMGLLFEVGKIEIHFLKYILQLIYQSLIKSIMKIQFNSENFIMFRILKIFFISIEIKKCSSLIFELSSFFKKKKNSVDLHKIFSSTTDLLT